MWILLDSVGGSCTVDGFGFVDVGVGMDVDLKMEWELRVMKAKHPSAQAGRLL